MGKNGKVKGRVTGSLFGICTNISYEDGCQRPDDKGLVTNSEVISEVSVVNGICEHQVLEVREPYVPAPKPEPIRQPLPTPQTKPLTVESILKSVEAKKAQPRLAVPKTDAPTSDEIIAKAKIPPKVRVDLSTSPAGIQAAAKIPREEIFAGDLEGFSASEIEELRTGIHAEPISGAEPLSPFASSFSASPAQQQPTRKAGKPVSRFDM